MTTLVWNYLPEYDTERGFEDEYATYHGVPQCVGVDNGTNAIKLGLRALGFWPGDEVITVSNTAAPTAVAIDSPC